MRRRRCFENAKPRRSAGGAQLNRFLGELDGPSGDLDLRLFATVSAFSSAESGSGEPPDRAQICALLLFDASLKLFFPEPILGPPRWGYFRENAKKRQQIIGQHPSCGHELDQLESRTSQVNNILWFLCYPSHRPSPEAQPAPRVHSSPGIRNQVEISSVLGTIVLKSPGTGIG